MTDTALKFGPDWLRALSEGNNHGGSPPPSPGPRYQLAEHRYGREEMLALFDRTVRPPDHLRSFPPLYVEKLQQPLALIQMTEEETRMWQRGINSDAVLRLTGKGTAQGPRERGRGGSVDRGRGRGGRGGYYSRGLSFEEDGEIRREGGPPSGFSRGSRIFDRSQSAQDRSWGERNGVDPGDWNGSTSPRKDFGRGLADNWRRSRGGEDDDGWRTSNRSEKWGRGSWREGTEREHDGMEQERGRGWDAGDGRRSRWLEEGHPPHPRRMWDEGDPLPEWATENPSESGGSFDASGAFHGGGYSDDEEDPVSESNREAKVPVNKKTLQTESVPRKLSSSRDKGSVTRSSEQDKDLSSASEKTPKDSAIPTNTSPPVKERVSPKPQTATSQNSLKSHPPVVVPKFLPPAMKASVPPPTIRQKSEDDMEHMQEVADNLVAKLMEEEERKEMPPVPLNHNVQSTTHHDQWYYRDPQGEVQGPFTAMEMSDWFRAGYFTTNLLVRRDCDEHFSQLGELMKVWGRMPFQAGPAPPPFKASDPTVPSSTSVVTPVQSSLTPPSTAATSTPLSTPEQETLLMQQYQYQLLQQQLLLRQQQAAAVQAIIGKLSQNEHWSTLTGPEQQQMIMQQLLTQQLEVNPYVQQMQQMKMQSDIVQNNPVMALFNQMQQQPKVTPSENLLSAAPGTKTDPIQQLIQQMAVQSNATPAVPPQEVSKSDNDPIQSLLRQLGTHTNGPLTSQSQQVDSLWGNSSVPHQFSGPGWLTGISAPPGQLHPLSAQSGNLPASLWDLQGKDMKTEQQILAEQIRAEEERKKEELRKEELKRKEEEEKRRLQEELRKKEEEKIRLEEQMRKLEEEKRQEEKRRKEEEKKRQQEEKKRLEEKKRQEEELKRKKAEEERKRLEELRRKEIEEQKKQEEQKRKEEEKRRKEEERRRRDEEERKQKEEEEMRRVEEEERRRQEELRREEEEQQQRRVEQQRRQQEALRRLQEQQQQRAKAAPWSQQAQPTQILDTMSLTDIQRLQEKEKREQQQQQQQLLLQLQQQTQQAVEQQTNQRNSLQLKWAERASSAGPVKSLAEIQAEEQEQMMKQQERDRAERGQTQLCLSSSSIWETATQNLSWSSRTGQASQSVQNVWATSGSSSNTNAWGNNQTAWSATGGGFWEEPSPVVTKSNKPGAKSTPSENAVGSKPVGNVSTKGGKARSKKDEEVVLKIFEQNVQRADEFTQWCNKTLSGLQSSVDVPTFVGFLKDIESPYEVNDYVRSYLGEGHEMREFARQFLERRSKWRNAQKATPEEDDMCIPAPAVNPLNNDFQEVKGKGRKVKKNKMLKVDSRILGFSVTAAPDRINVGDRDYGEGV